MERIIEVAGRDERGQRGPPDPKTLGESDSGGSNPEPTQEQQQCPGVGADLPGKRKWRIDERDQGRTAAARAEQESTQELMATTRQPGSPLIGAGDQAEHETPGYYRRGSNPTRKRIQPTDTGNLA